MVVRTCLAGILTVIPAILVAMYSGLWAQLASCPCCTASAATSDNRDTYSKLTRALLLVVQVQQLQVASSSKSSSRTRRQAQADSAAATRDPRALQGTGQGYLQLASESGQLLLVWSCTEMTQPHYQAYTAATRAMSSYSCTVQQFVVVLLDMMLASAQPWLRAHLPGTGYSIYSCPDVLLHSIRCTAANRYVARIVAGMGLV